MFKKHQHNLEEFAPVAISISLVLVLWLLHYDMSCVPVGHLQMHVRALGLTELG